MPDKRHFHRIPFALKTDLEISETIVETSLVDISLKGALVGCAGKPIPEAGNHCRLTIHLNFSDVVLTIEGKVVHVHDGLAGIKFTRIDIDSMIHLRRLVELNSKDPDQVRTELHDFWDYGDER